MFDQNESILITRDLLIALGLEIQKETNILVNQEDKSQIAFENKFVKANTDPEKTMYIDPATDVKLDPLNPKCTKMMEMFFGKYITDEAEQGNIPECLSYYFDKDEDQNKYRLAMKNADGSMWFGNWYFNKIICYIEAIFSIDGTFADKDLRPYDIEQED